MKQGCMCFVQNYARKIRSRVWMLCATIWMQLLCPQLAVADNPQNIGTIASGITASFYGLTQFMTGFSYLAGLGFVLGSVLKFKAHRDNPTQIPIGTPVVLLGVGACLMFLPTIFKVAGATVFGSGGQTGGLTGVSTFS